jgi:hypothetical protein
VRLGDTVVELVELHRAPERYEAVFVAARAAPGHGECLCTTPAPWLVIRRRAGRFHVARWPDTTAAHAPECSFRHEEMTGREGYTRAALVEDTEETRIRLRSPLSVTLTPGGRTPGDAKRGGDCKDGSPASMGLLGLAHYLWECAGLHTWPARGTRGWADVSAALSRAAGGIVVSGQGLTEACYIIPAWSRADSELITLGREAFTHQLGVHGQTHRYGLLLGELATLTESAYGYKAKLAHFGPAVFLSDRLIESLRRRYRAAMSTDRPAGSRRIVLAHLDHTSKGYLAVLDAAVLLTTRGYVPVESSHELVMAEALATAGRAFTKPLRYDAHRDQTFPDFLLTDVTPTVPVEVWGLPGRVSYELRKVEKRALYAARPGALLEWNIREPLPRIPAAPTRSPATPTLTSEGSVTP